MAHTAARTAARTASRTASRTAGQTTTIDPDVAIQGQAAAVANRMEMPITPKRTFRHFRFMSNPLCWAQALLDEHMSRSIDYGNLMHRAMRALIQDVLTDVAENGLPGAHHFFITFDTTHADAHLADWLKERYPTEMTVVMQHWFDDLDVTNDGFSITLNFGDSPERLVIPYDAIKTFVDPSVEFGLRFETQEQSDEDDDPEPPHPLNPEPRGATDPKDTAPAKDAEVVSLDSFRK